MNLKLITGKKTPILMNYLKFKSCDDRYVYCSEEDILKNAPVLARLLNIKKEFCDVPKMEDNAYLYFNDLHYESLLLIMVFLSSEYKLTSNEYKETYFYDLTKSTKTKFYNAAVIKCEPICIYLPREFYKFVNKPPMDEENDIYNEYMFFEMMLSNGIERNESYSNLSNFLNEGWSIVNQTWNESLSHLKETWVKLRKKIQ